MGSLMIETTKKVFGGSIPEYAILSHTWGDEEVELQDFASGNVGTKAGWSKITSCCAVAASEGWQWVWIDTCCIDKSSSAELTESINSMFTWYENSGTCYAYLSDVPADVHDHSEPGSSFRRSRWFTRGWTLQELLAPPFVLFFNQSWKVIGTRSSQAEVIASITGITPTEMTTFRSTSVAVKMSWASSRETMRKEDIAYCLLGLFGVTMPLLYGEGEDAFVRLQQEILKTSDDESIFAWKGQWQGLDDRSDLFASSPAAFRASSNIHPLRFDQERAEYAITNKGLRIQLSLYPQRHYGTDVYLAPLNCTYLGNNVPLAVYLQKEANGKYSRYKPDSLPLFETSEYSPSNDKQSPAAIRSTEPIYIQHITRRHQKQQPSTIAFLFNLYADLHIGSVTKYTPGSHEYHVKKITAERIGRLMRRDTNTSTTSSSGPSDLSPTSDLLPIDKRGNYRIDYSDNAIVIATVKPATSLLSHDFSIILYLHQSLVSVRVSDHPSPNPAAVIEQAQLNPFTNRIVDRASLRIPKGGGQMQDISVMLRPRPSFGELDYVPGYLSEDGNEREKQFVIYVDVY